MQFDGARIGGRARRFGFAVPPHTLIHGVVVPAQEDRYAWIGAAADDRYRIAAAPDRRPRGAAGIAPVRTGEWYPVPRTDAKEHACRPGTR
ncbi:hypothetical protein [Allonocardiopsis opalescens]|uniref:Uncharacterized protein n=1 Tax=Allonocardiopsis opalescens TaxID=1144618 RepID=A0A2T0Q6Z2_9ACTN|nr:hypothetical protein [Allonocardiopsis opalescens]PRX99589.1 hypothetical protein CLV72_103191 [Allonocardiopsis opalescens]